MNSISWWRTSFGEPEIEGMTNAIRHEHISQGPVTEQFEEEIAHLLGVPHAVAATSGSTALLMALMALGIGAGDEVLIPDRTWIATAHAVLLAGAKVVLVDVLPDLPLIDVSQIEKKITPRTKAILPVHLNGRSVRMDELYRIAERHGLLVIEDACQAFFSKSNGRYLGTQSDAGCSLSASPSFCLPARGGLLLLEANRHMTA